MYTVDCKDPDCVKCKQDPKGRCSGEEKQSKIPEENQQSSEVETQTRLLSTMTEIAANDFYEVLKDREVCLSTFRKLKEEVHCKMNELMSILRKRELELCLKIDEECSLKLLEIDQAVTSNCAKKIKSSNRNLTLHPSPLCLTPVFFCTSFDDIKMGLQNFGSVGFEYSDDTDKKRRQELGGARQRMPAREPPSASISDCSVKEGSKTTPNDEMSLAERQQRTHMKLLKFSQELGLLLHREMKEDFRCKENSKINMKEKISRDFEKYGKNYHDLTQKMRTNVKGPHTSTEEFMVPCPAVDMLVDEAFDIISQIQQETGASIELIQRKEDFSGDKLCRITGSVEQVQKASANIRDLIKGLMTHPTLMKVNCNSEDSKSICKLEHENTIVHDREVVNLQEFLKRHGKRIQEKLKAQRKDKEKKSPQALKLKVVCENSKNLLIADEVTGRTCIVDRYSWTKDYQDNSSNETEELPELQQPSMTTPAKKHFECIARKITEARKKRDLPRLSMDPSDSESTDLVPDKEDGKNNSVRTNAQGGTSICEFLIPWPAVGAVIGTNCDMIHRIQRDTGASVQVIQREEEDFTTGKLCRITGSNDQVQKADAMISDIIVCALKNDSPFEVKVSTVLPKCEKSSQSSESTDSLMSEEAENDSSLDEDDIEIITKNETDSIPFELTFTPPLPMKSRFKIKPSSLATSFFRKRSAKKPRSSGNGVESESSDISARESKEASPSSSPSSVSYIELKKNPWVQEQPAQESPSDGSKDVGPDNNPTAALRSSFLKYLQKNAESEWLAATAKISEQSQPGEKGCIKILVPATAQDLNPWLSMTRNQKGASGESNPAHN